MSAIQPQEGRIFTFGSDPYRRMPVFLSGRSNRVIVWVGGQADGFFALNYMTQLIDAMVPKGWAVAQVILSSCQVGSTSNHVNDAEDLDTLVNILVKEHGATEIALFGSSTGVQVVMEWFNVTRNKEWVTRVILQGIAMEHDAPIFTVEGVEALRDHAEKLVSAGRGEEVEEMRTVYDIPVSASRVSKGGFLTIQEAIWIPLVQNDFDAVRQNVKAIDIPSLILIAPGPRYVITAGKRKEHQEYIERHCGFVQDVTLRFFDDTCDERRRMLKTHEAQHTDAIDVFLASEDKKRKEREDAEAARIAEEVRRSRSILHKQTLKELE